MGDTVGECGQVTLPQAFVAAAEIRPGDFVHFRVTGPNSIELSFFHRLSLEEMLERYRIDGPVDVKAELEAMYEELADDFMREIERNAAGAARRPGADDGPERHTP